MTLIAFYLAPSALIIVITSGFYLWDKLQWRRTERKFSLMCDLEAAWLLPPAERRLER